MKFTHLHTHSHYSLLDGLAKIGDIIQKAKDYNMDSVALTDHGVMYGAIEFYEKALAEGIKPIIGLESYIVDGSRLDKTRNPLYHLVLLAKNKTGYSNLLKLTTAAHLEGYYYKPRIDWEILSKHSEGLVAMSACVQGQIPRTFLNNGYDEAKELTKKYLNLFGEDFYLEVQRHPNVDGQEEANQGLIKIGKELSIPIVATNDAHYLNVEDEDAQDALLCLQTKRKIKDTDRMNMLGMNNSFKTTEEMLETFYDFKEAVSNTEDVVKKCNLEIELGKITLPVFEVPKGKTDSEFLRDLCMEGLKERYPEYYGDSAIQKDDTDKFKKEVIDRLDFEFSVIDKMGFASYFLIVQDFVNWARAQKIVVGPGRGSAAGSLIAYLTHITNIDPLKYDLMFERFLNPDRISMPDIDLDFADTRRDEVIRYVEEKYGRENVSQVITFGTMAARAAVRDSGRVLDFEYDFCDKISKLIPMFTSLQKAIDEGAELNEMYTRDPNAKKVLDTALKLEGVARHASTHACAVLITKDPLSSSVPLQHASSGDQTVVSQYSGKIVEKLGLLKMDFLGLRNLTIIENALKIIKNTKGEDVDIDNISLEDEETFKLFSRGDTTGVFQFESSGMRKYLKQLRPSVFEDVIAMVALYRPGPLNSGMIDEFIDRKHGKKAVTFNHPIMENSLKNTYGVIVYQEQVMQLSKDMAGFTGGQADTLRKAMGKKIASLMAKMKTEFIEGCLKNNISKNLAENTFTDMEKFAEYGFNRSHAACYGLIGYQTAYLKASYPVEFMAALLTANEGDVDKIAIDVQECQKMGIEVLPPDINESFEHFTVVTSEGEEKDKIRFGLLTIKNVGKNVVEEIIKERKAQGQFKDLVDFLERIKTKDLNKKSLESLIKCGAMSELGERSMLLHNLENLLDFIKQNRTQQNSQQGNLLGMLSNPYKSTLQLEEISKEQQVRKKEKLSWEKELLGLYVSDHPFVKYLPYIETKTIPLIEFNKENDYGDEPIIVAGIISKIEKKITKKGDAMIFAKMEDNLSNIEVLVFPRLLEENKEIWEEEKIIALKGKLTDKEGIPKIIAQSVAELNSGNINSVLLGLKSQNNEGNKFYYRKKESTDQASGPTNSVNRFMDIKMPKTVKKESLVKIKDIFKGKSGETKVRFILENGNGNKIINTSFSISPNDAQEVRKKLFFIVGGNNVLLK
jgi:DNA polymerase III subunit alpha